MCASAKCRLAEVEGCSMRQIVLLPRIAKITECSRNNEMKQCNKERVKE